MNFGIRATQNVNKALKYASEMAADQGGYRIGTEHLLYGLACVKDSVASKILAMYGITDEDLEGKL